MLTDLAETIVAWETKGLSNEKIKSPITANSILSPKIKWHKTEIRVKFNGSWLRQDKVTSTPRNVCLMCIN